MNLVNETEKVGATGKQEDCPCCNDEYSDRRCYCPPSCPDYEPGDHGSDGGAGR